MKFQSVIAKLYFLLIHADNTLNDKEVSFGKRMVSHEKLDMAEFERELSSLKSRPHEKIYQDCLGELKRLPKDEQIRCIAWMCVVANADGFMDKTEWQFIYKIYHKELHLPLNEIMKIQNDLIRVVHQLPQTVPGKSI